MVPYAIITKACQHHGKKTAIWKRENMIPRGQEQNLFERQHVILRKLQRILFRIMKQSMR
jgi:hypothetical protein